MLTACQMCSTTVFTKVCAKCNTFLGTSVDKNECDKYKRLGVCGQMGAQRNETIRIPSGFADSHCEE